MSKKSNSREFIIKANKIHNSKYNYSLVNYVTAIVKVKILCNKHGIFLQSPNKHLCGRGCKKCANDKMVEYRTKSVNTFIKQSNLLHINKYDYSKVIYLNTHLKVNIVCDIHGQFSQKPSKHLSGNGCPKCGHLIIAKKARENPKGWTYTNWEKAGEISRNFESYKVYIIKCWNEEEVFYKIGKTFLNLSLRFKNKRFLPYNFKIVKIYTDTAIIMSNLEKQLKINNKEHLYVPKLKFNGMYECFKKIN